MPKEKTKPTTEEKKLKFDPEKRLSKEAFDKTAPEVSALMDKVRNELDEGERIVEYMDLVRFAYIGGLICFTAAAIIGSWPWLVGALVLFIAGLIGNSNIGMRIHRSIGYAKGAQEGMEAVLKNIREIMEMPKDDVEKILAEEEKK